MPERSARRRLSLSLRLVLSLSALILLLGLVAFLAIGRMTARLQEAVGESAGAVGRSLVHVLYEADAARQAAESAHAASRAREEAMRAAAVAAHEAAEHERHREAAGAEARALAEADVVQREIRMVVNGRELSAQEVAAFGASQRADFDPRVLRFEVLRERGEPRLQVIGLGPDLRIALPRSPVERALDEFRLQLLWGLGGLLLMGIIGASLIARRLTRPLQALAQGAEALGRGQRAVQVASAGPPELRASIEAFNRMSADLARHEAEAGARREQRALAELGEIGRGLAHSLRNPLHALGLSLEALASRSNAQDAAGLAAAGREQLANIDQALRGFLALASAEGVRAERLPLGEVIDDVLLEARQRCATEVTLERALQPVQIRAVRAELRILVHTLVMNAIEAAPAGSRVRVACRVEGAGACIEVEDEGAGVPEALRARLFAPHVSSKPTGAGMGLYLSQRLVRQRYAGDIELQPRQPRGTRAVLHLNDRREESERGD